jgi:hypothetical protein
METLGDDDMITKDLISKMNAILDNLNLNFSDIKEKTPQSDPLKDIQDNLLSIYSQYRGLWSEIHNVLTDDFKKETVITLKSVISADFIKLKGIAILKKNVIELPLHSVIPPRAINSDYWISVKEMLLSAPKYQNILKKLTAQYRIFIDQQVDQELHKVLVPIQNELKTQFRKAYYKSPLTFEEFLTQMNVNTNTHETHKLRRDFESAIQKKNMEIAQDKQQKSFDNYQRYFSMDERELARAKRQGTMQKRVFSKKSRQEKPNKKEQENP